MEQSKQRNAGRWKLFLILAVCASPVIASYLTYYVIKPETRTNYGDLIDPRAYQVPATLDGGATSLGAFKGKWVMLQVGNAECADNCRKHLHDMRQLRLAQGKDKDRIERVWLITDDKPLETVLMREYDGTHMLRAKPEALRPWLPADSGASPSDHIYMIDPLGNLMMLFAKDADPSKVKKDIAKLQKASHRG